MSTNSRHIRLLTPADVPQVERLIRSSEYIYQRFTPEELPLLIERYPAMGDLHNASLHGFLISQITNPPIAWIGGFGVSWSESKYYISILDNLIEDLNPHLRARGAQALYYSGNDMERDWLRPLLLVRGFQPYCQLYAYDKYDYTIPTPGNTRVTVRPVQLGNGAGLEDDTAALLAIEELCFDELWRYDATAFRDIANSHPYFVVAEQNGQVIGYQFNTVEADYGYLVRIAVHPAFERQGIGARLMAEAVRYFASERVTRIMLNTEEQNTHAHRLYEWFGFIRLAQRGFVLRQAL